MVKQYKIDEVQSLSEKLKKKRNIILTNYSGIKVKDLSDLRRKLRSKGCDYKVVKNNLFKRAIKDTIGIDMDKHLVGPVGVVFTETDLGEAAKILKDFNKEIEKFSFSVGVMDNVIYTGEQVRTIADLPSKEVLLSQIMSLLNGPASKVAIGTNQIMASLARGINAVAEKNAL
ncbi:MAG: 50S ribosomal protein L10 [Spirochaetes bacterium]|nr:MAG: 50S ribosomal protein L10 [Spirochaetota bacterium]